MSEFIDSADELKTYIESLPEMAGIDVFVDRQKDLENQINISVAGAKGAVVDILWMGGPPIDEEGLPNILSRYRINVRTTPILRSGAVPADTLCQAVIKALWQWRDADNQEWSIIDVDLMPDEEYLIYQVIAEVRTEIK